MTDYSSSWVLRDLSLIFHARPVSRQRLPFRIRALPVVDSCPLLYLRVLMNFVPVPHQKVGGDCRTTRDVKELEMDGKGGKKKKKEKKLFRV